MLYSLQHLLHAAATTLCAYRVFNAWIANISMKQFRHGGIMHLCLSVGTYLKVGTLTVLRISQKSALPVGPKVPLISGGR